MKISRKLSLAVLLVLFAVAFAAQSAPVRPYHDGPVWGIVFIKVKPGVGLNYMNYLATDWKREQEALKGAHIVLDYKVIQTEAHGENDWNLMLISEYRDLGSMEVTADRARAIAMQALAVNDEKMIEGYKDRAEWREIIGNRIAREVVLEPK